MAPDSTGPDAGQDPRARLLTAAREAFARHGFDGASVRDITGAAGVNLGAITYHFGSKDALYHEVLRGLVGPVLERLRASMRIAAPPLDRLDAAVRSFFAHIGANPEMPAIMVREMASGRAIAEPILTMMGEALPLVAAAIAEGQRDGSIRPGDPLLLTLSCFAQPVYLNLARPALAAVAKLDLADPAAYATVVDHAALVVRRMLETR